MIGFLGTTIIVGALLVAAWAGVSALRRRDPFLVAAVVAAVTEVVLLVQAVIAIVSSFNGETADAPGLFFGYLVAVILVLPATMLWSRAERNQFGSVVILVGGLVLAVLVVRLQQIWGAPVA